MLFPHTSENTIIFFLNFCPSLGEKCYFTCILINELNQELRMRLTILPLLKNLPHCIRGNVTERFSTFFQYVRQGPVGFVTSIHFIYSTNPYWTFTIPDTRKKWTSCSQPQETHSLPGKVLNRQCIWQGALLQVSPSGLKDSWAARQPRPDLASRRRQCLKGALRTRK